MENKLNLLKKLIRLQLDKTINESQLTEASANALKSKYETAIKKEQQLSSLMLTNLVKYKQAKASGNEKAIAKYTKIAGQLSPKKKRATEDANKAYQAYEDKISGLHADAELVIDENNLNERLVKGLKPLLMIGSTIKSTVGEDALVDLSDKFDEIDDEQADDIASHLNMAIELMQDRSAAEGRAWLKKFNKACKDALSGKSIKSAFEGKVTESVLRGQLAGDSALDMANHLRQYGVKKILKQPNDSVTYLQLNNASQGTKVVAMLKKMFGIKAQIDNHMYAPSPAVKFDNDQIAESKLTEASRKDSGMSSSVSKRRAGAELKQKLAGKRSDGMGKYTATIYGMNGSKRVELKSLNDLNKFSKFELDENTTDGPRYKKYVAKAFEDILGAQFDFRHAMGVKQLTNKDMKLKKKADAIYKAIIDLQKDMRSRGLTEGMLNEMDINDPILVAIRARKADLKKKAKSAPKVKKISTKQYYKLMDMEIDLISQMKDAAKKLEQLDSEMNREAGQKGDKWTDADANRYGGDLNKLQTKVEKLAKQKLKVKKAIMSYRIN
jgi:hypothetical protein